MPANLRHCRILNRIAGAGMVSLLGEQLILEGW